MVTVAAPAIPITAYSVSTALGSDSKTTLDALFEGKCGLVSSGDSLPFRTQLGAVPELPALPREFQKHESRVARIANLLFGEIEAPIARAVARWGAHRVGIIMGTSTGGLAETENAIAKHTQTGAFPDEFDIQLSHGMFCAPCFLSAITGVTGPVYGISTACSSSGKVFSSAQRLIHMGMLDAVIVGGVDSLCQTTLRGFHSLGILSEEACRPFGKDRRGINLSEGGGLFLLEREGDAQAMLLSVGESADGYHMSSPHPEGAGAKLAMQYALSRAGLQGSDIDYLNAHGTGTPQNDITESRAVLAVFNEKLPLISATKGATGHALGAAGAIEAAICIASMQRGLIAPSLRSNPMDPEITLPLVHEKQAAKLQRTMSNSFGFGGSNVSVIFGAAS